MRMLGLRRLPRVPGEGVWRRREPLAAGLGLGLGPGLLQTGAEF